MDSIFTVLITLITVLGSSAAWKYYNKKLKVQNIDDHAYVNNLKERIERMEKLLDASKDEKDELRGEIIKLTAITAALKVKVEHLMKENSLLKKKRKARVGLPLHKK